MTKPFSVPALTATSHVADDHDPALQADRALLQHVCRQARIRTFIEHMYVEVALVSLNIVSADQPFLTLGTDASVPPSAVSRVPVIYNHRSIGDVCVYGNAATDRAIARLTAHWLVDQLMLEHELQSLTSEVVHSYEELHLLFELSSALGGVLDHQVGDTLTDKPKGTGLGLCICREIVNHYGGHMWLDSALGCGSTFSFRLPLVPAQVDGSDPS